MKRVVWVYLMIGVSTALFACSMFSCSKESGSKTETGTVMDVEGNVYAIVKIGEQWWMAEDLKVTRYNNNNNIALIQTNTTQWAADTTGAYCTGIYGNYYNWYAVASGNLAPEGWHIATDGDWKKLEEHLGMSNTETDKVSWRGTNEGEKLKKDSVEYWIQYPNVWATNETGFAAKAGNCRLFNGGSGEPFGSGYTGFWWSSTENSGNNQAWYRHMDYKNANIFRFYGPKTYGFSIRCVKN